MGFDVSDLLPWKTLFSESIGKVLDSVLPDSMTEEEKQTIKLKAKELSIKEAEVSYKEMKLMYDDVNSARELAKADSMSDSTLSKNVRPLFLITIMGIMIWANIIYPSFISDSGSVLELGSMIQELSKIVVGFYFGGRTLEKTANTLMGGGVKDALGKLKGLITSK